MDPVSLPLVLSPVYDRHSRWVGLYVRGPEGGDLPSAELAQVELHIRQAALPAEPLFIDVGEGWLRQGTDAAAPSSKVAVLRRPRAAGLLSAPADVQLASVAFPPLAGHIPVLRADTADSLPDALVSRLAGAGLPPTVLGVDSEEMLAALAARGFLYFTFGKLKVCPHDGSQRTAAQAAVLQLLDLLARDADNRELEAVLKREPQLAFDLLRLTNSAANGLRTRITNFRHAITLLGQRRLKRWLQLLLFTQPKSGGRRSEALLQRAAWRGRMMELLIAVRGPVGADREDEAFMVGAFSLLDVLLGVSLARLLEPLHVADAVSGALLARRGELGACLKIIEGLEQPEQGSAPAGEVAAAITLLQVQALAWAAGIEAGR